ncbi:MAG: type II secretion system protein N, partial [Pseudomonadota bacterium]
VIDAVEPTPLNLVLRGVVAGQSGYAIIVDENGDEGVYRVNDQIAGGARVERIENRRVIMVRNGRREGLELPGASLSAQSAPSNRLNTSSQPGQDGMASGIGIASLTSRIGAVGVDPSVLANQIIILPVASGGFRVRAGRDAGLFTQLGFHLNDIVLAINGQPVNNQSDVQAIFTDVQPGVPIAITIKRGDRQLVLTPDINQIFGG